MDRLVEDLVHADHLFAAALYICGAHASGHGSTLLRSYGCETLCFEEVDAGALSPQIRFQTDKNEGGRGAEM